MSTYLASIGFAKDGLNAAWEIAKALRSAETQIKTAELKIKLAEMMLALADAKANLADVQEQLHDNAKELDRLENALRNKDQVRKQYDAYYAVDEQGNLTGAAYCMRCWEVEHKLHHLATRRGMRSACHACKAEYDPHRTRELELGTPPLSAP